VVIHILRTQRDNLHGDNATQASSVKYQLAHSLEPVQQHLSSGQSEHGLGGRAFNTCDSKSGMVVASDWGGVAATASASSSGSQEAVEKGTLAVEVGLVVPTLEWGSVLA